MTSETVASHYNAVKQEGIEERKNSKIFHLRNINNWMKNCLINEAIDLLKRDRIYQPKVLDLACGKGGDLPKWSIARVGSVVLTDIAEVSVEQARGRYEESKAERRCNFPAQFITLDSCNNELAPLIDPAFLPIDIVSCQFAFHYSFVNEPSARQMLRNAVASLRPGGLFIGTLPDAERIVWAARSAADNDNKWENRVCSVHYDGSTPIDDPPLFGAQFDFNLDEQVNCPEFLAYFPLLVKLAEEEGMELLWEKRFPQAAEEYLKNERWRSNLYRKLKEFNHRTTQLETEEEGQFDHVKDLLTSEEGGRLTTLSKAEWEVFSMYITFCFRKKE
ncbi:hypothetical protein PRIPAC_88877 [Pristionchus pacificus]|uniref:mRNA (guanine-N(7))-methyltransferase n=1 Tax=Pristionchus pacificus TaxID=54126 RepID=A0A2A6B725_PRIPA|nr:hypothetical protein PRIPAC_88877 [Pristionchus pacificus]|eukprot:PDM61653.1 tag-72 [Pristionchus pacificus]